MSKVITFGEIMLRLSPEGYNRILQSDKFEATFAGAEANVAVSLANFGVNVSFVSKITENPIGQACVNSLRQYGVDTSNIVRGGDRLGVYYVEKGASQRPSQVTYDRNGSAIQLAKSDDFDWKKIFLGAEWFHFTGITPALSDDLADICEEACKYAKEHNIKISCDLNYRNKLWSKEKAKVVMTRLCKYVDVCIANEEDVSDVFGITAGDTSVISGKLDIDGYKIIAKKLVEKFNFKYVAFTLRESINANDNRWSGMLYDGSEFFNSNTYDIHIVDRVGGGDSFGAALIYGMLNNFDNQKIIDFAIASSTLKHSIEGDFNLVTVDEVLRLMNGDKTGRVKR